MENIIFKSIVGSYAYGTYVEGLSDIDHKGVYIQPIDEIIGFKQYKEQINANKDETYFEIGRFLSLLQTANPTVLELLYMPEHCIVHKDPIFNILIDKRDIFLTKKAINSFGGYAISQIRKARGLNKKINWERTKMIRKTPLDFCYVSDNGKTKELVVWLSERSFKQEECGLVNLDHMKDNYALYHSKIEKFNGITHEDSNDVVLSSIPKGSIPEITMYFNRDGYSSHCKDFREYTIWLEKRNVNRFVNTQETEKIIDGKNMLHCRRLLDMAKEIVTDKTITVARPNAQELLKIRNGDVDMLELLDEAEKDILLIEDLFKSSDLPDSVSDKEINNILLRMRRYNEPEFRTIHCTFA